MQIQIEFDFYWHNLLKILIANLRGYSIGKFFYFRILKNWPHFPLNVSIDVKCLTNSVYSDDNFSKTSPATIPQNWGKWLIWRKSHIVHDFFPKNSHFPHESLCSIPTTKNTSNYCLQMERKLLGKVLMWKIINHKIKLWGNFPRLIIQWRKEYRSLLEGHFLSCALSQFLISWEILYVGGLEIFEGCARIVWNSRNS